ncbi:PhoX family phosphatase, partial [Lamprobacter modestohalophilus]|nr:PhoX family phosphatase [Lamprobacter modestohalophilus]
MSERLPANLMIEDNGDEPMSNPSDNPHFSSIMEKRFSRRQVLAGGIGAAVAGLFSATGVAHAKGPNFLPPAAQDGPPFGLNPTLGFDAIPVVRSDTATVPS